MRSGPHCPMSFLFNRVLLKMGLECGMRTPLAKRSERKTRPHSLRPGVLRVKKRKMRSNRLGNGARMPHSTCFLNRMPNVPPSFVKKRRTGQGAS